MVIASASTPQPQTPFRLAPPRADRCFVAPSPQSIDTCVRSAVVAAELREGHEFLLAAEEDTVPARYYVHVIKPQPPLPTPTCTAPQSREEGPFDSVMMSRDFYYY